MAMLSQQESVLIANLAEREAAMIHTTCELAEINSGSYNTAGITKVNEKLADLFSQISETHTEHTLSSIETISEKGNVEHFHSAPMQIFSARKSAPLQILCTGHSDTVFPSNSKFQATWREGNRLRGPGVADMKGGLVVLFEALNAIHHSPFKEHVGFTVAISPDEEIGSPSSAKILSQLAKDAHYGLTYEPALEDGTLAGARKGSGNFTIVAKGKSVHAGREFFKGRNALTAIAHIAITLEKLSNEEQGISINIGKISGGGAVNIVPDLATCRFNVRIHNTAQQHYIEQMLQTTIEQVQKNTGCQLTLYGNFNRPPKIVDDRQQKMFELLKECGQQLDLNIAFKATGGCCEGNNLSAAGLVNIDTLGVRGGSIHSEEEFACLDSFVERAQLSALLIAKLCQKSTKKMCS